MKYIYKNYTTSDPWVEDASGGEAYYYSKMGEVTKTVCTVMASVADIRTYVYGATYDSWNRVRTMTYPDGEVVTYHSICDSCRKALWESFFCEMVSAKMQRYLKKCLYNR